MLSDETRIAVPSGDGKTVYGILSRAEPASERVVLAAHGLAGQPDDFALRFARDRFLAAGFDVCRPAFYSWQRDARALRDTTLAVHARDLTAVYDRLAESYADIFLVGHSYGGIALVLAGLPGARAASLWDCLFSPARLWADIIACEPAADPASLEIRDPLRVQVGRAMREEGMALSVAAMRRAAAAIRVPVQIIVAGQGAHTDPAQDYADSFAGPVDRMTLPEADHLFVRGTCVERLCEETLRWFGRAPAAR